MTIDQLTKALLLMLGWSAILYVITVYVKKYVVHGIIQKWLPLLPLLLGAGSGLFVIDYILQLVAIEPPSMEAIHKYVLYAFLGVGAGASSVASHEIWQRRTKQILSLDELEGKEEEEEEEEAEETDG